MYLGLEFVKRCFGGGVCFHDGCWVDVGKEGLYIWTFINYYLFNLFIFYFRYTLMSFWLHELITIHAWYFLWLPYLSMVDWEQNVSEYMICCVDLTTVEMCGTGSGWCEGRWMVEYWFAYGLRQRMTWDRERLTAEIAAFFQYAGLAFNTIASFTNTVTLHPSRGKLFNFTTMISLRWINKRQL